MCIEPDKIYFPRNI